MGEEHCQKVICCLHPFSGLNLMCPAAKNHPQNLCESFAAYMEGSLSHRFKLYHPICLDKIANSTQKATSCPVISTFFSWRSTKEKGLSHRFYLEHFKPIISFGEEFTGKLRVSSAGTSEVSL